MIYFKKFSKSGPRSA